MTDMTAFLTVKDSATVQEYYDCFWSHARSNVLKVKGQTFEFESTRSAFVDEAQTTIYTNTKNPKELLLNCYSCDMDKMGAMMGGETFQAMGDLLWDMNPAKDMKIRGAEPAGAKADLVAFVSLKEGCSVEDYCELFWSHGEGTTLKCKQNGKTYEMDHSRGSMCDESRTKLFVNSKAADQIALCIYDCDVAKLGAMMGGPKFMEMGEAMWSMTGMHFMTSPPAPQPRTSTFFVIRHSFKFGKADEWWAAVTELQTSGKMAAWAEATKAMGFWNHTMLATGANNFCIWEAEEGKTGEDMQAFIDGEHGPSFGCLLNEVIQINGDAPFPHAFGAEAKEPAVHATADSPLFLIQHTFKPGMAAQWWGEFGQLAAEPEKMAAWTAEVEKAGFFNHCFMPSGQDTDAFCIWEAQPGTTPQQMQTFIDGPLGPSFGCFTNKVMLIDEPRSNVAAVERKFTEHTVIARFTPAEGKDEELLKVFTDVLPGTASGPHGNNLIEAYVDPATKDIVLYEKWASKGHFERYLAFRTEDGTFGKILALVANPPNIAHLHRELDGEVRNNVLNAGHTVCAKFTAVEGKRAELMQIFADAYPVTFAYEGNRHLSMYTDPSDANAFTLWEQWTEPKAFEGYFAFRVAEGFLDKISPMLAAPPAPAPLELRWQNKEASTVKLTLPKAKATDAALRLASPSNHGVAPPASPKKLRTTTA